MNNIKIFRILIIINVVVYLCAIALPFIDSNWLSEKEFDVLSYLGYEAIIELPSIINWIILLSWFLIITGMYFFISSARHFFLLWVCFTTALAITSGMSVMTALDVLYSDLGGLLDGAILAMAYFSDVSTHFQKSKK